MLSVAIGRYVTHKSEFFASAVFVFKKGRVGSDDPQRAVFGLDDPLAGDFVVSPNKIIVHLLPDWHPLGCRGQHGKRLTRQFFEGVAVDVAVDRIGVFEVAFFVGDTDAHQSFADDVVIAPFDGGQGQIALFLLRDVRGDAQHGAHLTRWRLFKDQFFVKKILIMTTLVAQPNFLFLVFGVLRMLEQMGPAAHKGVLVLGMHQQVGQINVLLVQHHGRIPKNIADLAVEVSYFPLL